VTFDHELVLALHGRLVAGDRVASAELSRLVVPELVRRLSSRWPSLIGTDSVHDVAVDVFVAYLRSPERFDPGRSSLVGWLQFQAHADLTNDYRSPRRTFHQRRVVLLGSDPVETSDAARNSDRVSTDVYPSDVDNEVLGRVLLAVENPIDRRLLGLIIDDERSTTVAARVLGIEHLPEREQARIVKQNKDRIKAKVRRLLKEAP